MYSVKDMPQHDQKWNSAAQFHLNRARAQHEMNRDAASHRMDQSKLNAEVDSRNKDRRLVNLGFGLNVNRAGYEQFDINRKFDLQKEKERDASNYAWASQAANVLQNGLNNVGKASNQTAFFDMNKMMLERAGMPPVNYNNAAISAEQPVDGAPLQGVVGPQLPKKNPVGGGQDGTARK